MIFSVSEFPRWPGLAHFDNFIHVVFSDGNKFRDMSKVCCISPMSDICLELHLQQVFYAALIYLTHTTSPEGYRLVRMLRSYLQLDSLLGLDIQTDSTLAMIEEELLIFDKELKVLSLYCIHCS